MDRMRISGLNSGMDTDSMVKQMMKIEQFKVDKIKKDKVKLEWKKETWEGINTKIFDFWRKNISEMRMRGTFSSKNALIGNSDVATVSATTNATRGSYNLEVQTLASGSFLASNEPIDDTVPVSAGKFQIKGTTTGTWKEINVSEGESIESIVGKINKSETGVIATYDRGLKRIFLSTATGDDKKIELENTEGNILSALKLGTENGVDGDGNIVFGKGSADAGSSAKILLNSQEFKFDSNNITIAGLSLNLKKTNQGQATTITVSQDTEGIYNKIKDFVAAYNDLIKEIDSKYTAVSKRGMEPLTKEEKEMMKEKEIEEYEKMIKDSLLKRDSILQNITGSMRTILGTDGSKDLDSKFRNLSQIGIGTGDYTEKGMLHIFGDKDNSAHGDKENKLMAAIESDPEKVMELMTTIGDKIYKDLQKKMSGSSMKSIFKFYNDKQMTKDIGKYDDRIKDMEAKLKTIENRYYKKFTNLEKVMGQMNNQSNWLQQQLTQMM